MGFDPPWQSDTSNEADALPPSHHRWITIDHFKFRYQQILKYESKTNKHVKSDISQTPRSGINAPTSTS